MLGREVRVPLSLLVPWPENEKPTTDYVAELKKRFEDAHQLATEKAEATHRSEQPRLDRKARQLCFQVGDLVRYWDPKPVKGVSHKLRSNWRGPWKVTKVITSCTYTIVEQSSGTSRTVNIDRLLPYVARSEFRFPPLPEDNQEPQPAAASDLDSSDDQEVQDSEQDDASDDRGGDNDDLTEQRLVDDDAPTLPEQHPTLTTRATRNRRPPIWLNDFVPATADLDSDVERDQDAKKKRTITRRKKKFASGQP
jgi:hypothetical protein